MSYNKKELTKTITNASRVAFKKILAEKPNETFFSFVLLTLDDVLSCYAYANSVESHLKTMNENDPNSEDENYYKWSPVEWEYSCISKEEFDKVYDLSEKIQDQLSEDNWYSYKLDFLECMELALEELDKEGVFGIGEKRSNITLFTTISDSFSTEEVEDHSAKKLNSSEVYKKFKLRFQ